MKRSNKTHKFYHNALDFAFHRIVREHDFATHTEYQDRIVIEVTSPAAYGIMLGMIHANWGK